MQNRSIIVKAAAINLVVFILFFLLAHPIYNSWEDVNALYILSGGYGTPPTEMVHYNYGIHSILGWCIKNGFLIWNKVNWYSLFLVLAHYISFTVILSRVIKFTESWLTYTVYAALFIVFEGYFLLYPDFTASSIALSTAAFLILLTGAWSGKLSRRSCWTAGILLLLASFYRIHIIIPLAGIAIIFLLLTTTKTFLFRSLLVILVAGICIFLFNLLQVSYYKAKKPDWAKEEAYRQKVYTIVNKPGSLKIPEAGQKWHNEYKLITEGIIIDTSLVPSTMLDSMYHDLKSERSVSLKLPPSWGKWFWINNRLFFLLAAFIIILFGLQRKIIVATFATAILIAIGFIFLIWRAKAPPYILTSAISLYCFAIFLYGKDRIPFQKKSYSIALLIIALLITSWGIVRVFHTSSMNQDGILLFKSQYAELAAHPNNLFIHTGNFQLSKFSVTDAPAKFPLSNYLNGDHFFNNTYQFTLNKFHIVNAQGIFTSPVVLFWGDLTDEQKLHFEKVAGRSLQFSAPLPEFKSANVWKIEAANY